jgi:hypothetical protein
MNCNEVSPSGDKPTLYKNYQTNPIDFVYSLTGKRKQDFSFSIELDALTGKKLSNVFEYSPGDGK